MSARDLEVVDYWLEKYPENLDLRFTKEIIFKMESNQCLKVIFCFVSLIHISNKKMAH